MMYDDSVKHYAVEPWYSWGFGVPAFGDNMYTANRTIANLVDEIGRAQLGIMTHIDARRRKPPSVNTLERVFKLLRRIHTILGTRKREYNERLLEGGHSAPSVIDFILHPVPYFNTELVKNKWLATWNEFIMVMLAHMMQHSDNSIPFDITAAFARENWQWAQRIKVMAATELLLVPRDQAEDENWWPTDEDFRKYDPLKVITHFEALDDPNPLVYFTEDDLRPLLIGIPAKSIKVAEPTRPTFSIGAQGTSPGTGAEEGGNTAGTTIGQPEV